MNFTAVVKVWKHSKCVEWLRCFKNMNSIPQSFDHSMWETEAWEAHVLSLDVQRFIKVIKHMRGQFFYIKQFFKWLKFIKKSNTQFKDYCIWQNSSVNSLFDQMAWKDQKSNMNCFHQTFLILLRSRTINRQKNMPTLLSICALGNEQFLNKCTPLENSWFIW